MVDESKGFTVPWVKWFTAEWVCIMLKGKCIKYHNNYQKAVEELQKQLTE